MLHTDIWHDIDVMQWHWHINKGIVDLFYNDIRHIDVMQWHWHVKKDILDMFYNDIMSYIDIDVFHTDINDMFHNMFYTLMWCNDVDMFHNDMFYTDTDVMQWCRHLTWQTCFTKTLLTSFSDSDIHRWCNDRINRLHNNMLYNDIISMWFKGNMLLCLNSWGEADVNCICRPLTSLPLAVGCPHLHFCANKSDRHNPENVGSLWVFHVADGIPEFIVPFFFSLWWSL